LKQPSHIKETPFQEGPLFAKAADLGSFADWPENAPLLRALNKRLKLFRGEDGWFARGSQGQLWEYGKGKLGFTVGTGKMIAVAIEAGFVPTQRGDGEANFSCDWSDENVGKLAKLLRLRIRKVRQLARSFRNATQSGFLAQIPLIPARTGKGEGSDMGKATSSGCESEGTRHEH
jgi:hypothetical protein